MEYLQSLKKILRSGQPIRFKVKIVPKSRENKIMGTLGPETIKIKIAAVAAKGKANEELIEFLAETFQKPKSHIVIKSGHTAPLKIIEILP